MSLHSKPLEWIDYLRFALLLMRRLGAQVGLTAWFQNRVSNCLSWSINLQRWFAPDAGPPSCSAKCWPL